MNLVGIVGGDGSIGLVLSYLLTAYGSEKNLPKILLLKGGTINFLASNLGIKTSALTCLNDTLFYIKKDFKLKETVLKTISVDNRIGFIFAGGMASTFLEDFYKNKSNSTGAAITLGKYFLDGLFAGKLNGRFKNLVKSQSLNIETFPQPLWQNKLNQKNKFEYTLYFASTIPNLPLKINLFKKVTLSSNTSEFVAIKETGKNLLISTGTALLGLDITKKPEIDSVIFENVRITAQNKSEKILYSIDGDLFCTEGDNLEIKQGPSITFCSPYHS